ncbi:hypothetical protein C8F04DRAFT_948393 [Mycena alexandri]|uniref:Exonuclease domain-containing protein n=1 Tax=Mycena alexandri TaxID=1745969 RepID=A0AAD6T735_9AGAR|nr:hypothetical protein C8F04DRAFT_948393 [Mycena alexandri]
MSQYPTPDQIVSLSTVCVGVGLGGSTSMLACVSLTIAGGEPLLDTFVRPTMQVTDYRAATTGIQDSQLFSSTQMPFLQTPLEDAVSFDQLQQHVANTLSGKIVVGHCLWNDLSVIGVPHPAVSTRDVALYQPFSNALKSPHRIIGLQTLCWEFMRRRCQHGLVDPIEDSRVAIDLYRSHATEWETTILRCNWPSSLPPSTFSGCYL